MLRKKEIDKKLFNYLLVKNPQLGRFYLLPKIHKKKILKENYFEISSKIYHQKSGTAICSKILRQHTLYLDRRSRKITRVL